MSGPRRRSGNRSNGGGAGRRHREKEAYEDRLTTALQALELGDLERARVEAGEAVRLDRSQAGPFLVLGEVHLLDEACRDAREAFERALRKADLAEDADLAVQARWGLARATWFEGRLTEAAGHLRRLMELGDEGTPHGVAQLLAEVWLRLGHADKAFDLLAHDDGLLPDGWLVRGFAAYLVESRIEAQACLRRALLGNIHLVAAILDEEPAELDFEPVLEEAGREYAEDVGLRLAPLLEERGDLRELVAALASTLAVENEISEFLDHARALRELPEGADRERHLRAVAALRDPGRLRESGAAVWEEMLAEDGEPGGFHV